MYPVFPKWDILLHTQNRIQIRIHQVAVLFVSGFLENGIWKFRIQIRSPIKLSLFVSYFLKISYFAYALALSSLFNRASFRLHYAFDHAMLLTTLHSWQRYAFDCAVLLTAPRFLNALRFDHAMLSTALCFRPPYTFDRAMLLTALCFWSRYAFDRATLEVFSLLGVVTNCKKIEIREEIFAVAPFFQAAQHMASIKL